MKCPACEGRGYIERNHGLLMVRCENCRGTKEIPDEVENDSNSGTEQDNKLIGSGDTGESKQPKKRQAKKKARARAS